MRLPYVAALGLVAALTVLSQAVMRASLPSRTRDADVLTAIATQRVQIEALRRRSEALVRVGHADDLAVWRAPLEAAIASFRAGQTELERQCSDLPVARRQAEYIVRQQGLATEIGRELIDEAIGILNRSGADVSLDARATGVHPVLLELTRLQNQLTPLYTDMQHTYRLAVEAEMRWVRTTEIIMLVGILVVLLLEAFFVFEPAVRTIRAQLEANRRAMEDLAQAKQAAESAARTKSEFLANMSHELRTPLTAILGFTDLMLDPAQSAEDRYDCINTIRRNGDHLVTLINDILDLSKIESGHMTIEHIDCSPIGIVQDVMSLMHVRSTGKEILLADEYIYPLPARISSDPVRIRQILVNLVGNAIKFTDDGGVRIILRFHASDSGNARLTFEVVDTGVGMTEAQMAAIFQPFKQADSSTTRRFGGTGLGLTICKRLASMLGGNISVTSAIGIGSCFTFSMELGRVRAEDLVTGPDAAGAGSRCDATAPARNVSSLSRLNARILLAEDGPDNQRFVSFILKRAGALVDIADNGRIAVDMTMAAVRNSRPYDIVLMDMQMPELDGYSATALLRSKGYTGPIIALTAHAMEGDRERCIAAGCDDYATKPIIRDTFIPFIAAHVTSNRPSTQVAL